MQKSYEPYRLVKNNFLGIFPSHHANYLVIQAYLAIQPKYQSIILYWRPPPKARGVRRDSSR
jgi:hypothetical protein